MKKICLYARTSTIRQHTENQVLLLKDYALKNGLEYDLYEEQESSRKTRPLKVELLRKLRAGEYSGVVVYALDRWARNLHELLTEVDYFTRNNIGFTSLREQIAFNTSSGKLYLSILGAFANFEKEILVERTILGIQRAKYQGIRIGRPPGKRDSAPRKKSGYFLREANKRKKEDEKQGIFLPIEEYISSKPNKRSQKSNLKKNDSKPL